MCGQDSYCCQKTHKHSAHIRTGTKINTMTSLGWPTGPLYRPACRFRYLSAPFTQLLSAKSCGQTGSCPHSIAALVRRRLALRVVRLDRRLEEACPSEANTAPLSNCVSAREHRVCIFKSRMQFVAADETREASGSNERAHTGSGRCARGACQFNTPCFVTSSVTSGANLGRRKVN